MTTSKDLAGLLGPALIGLTLSEGWNLHIFANVPAAFVYLNGTLLFVAGLAIVRAHNRWERSWTLLITLTGWGLVLGGLIRMFAPELAQQGTQPHALGIYAFIVLLCGLGVFLTIKAYGREAK